MPRVKVIFITGWRPLCTRWSPRLSIFMRHIYSGRVHQPSAIKSRIYCSLIRVVPEWNRFLDHFRKLTPVMDETLAILGFQTVWRGSSLVWCEIQKPESDTVDKWVGYQVHAELKLEGFLFRDTYVQIGTFSNFSCFIASFLGEIDGCWKKLFHRHRTWGSIRIPVIDPSVCCEVQQESNSTQT